MLGSGYTVEWIEKVVRSAAKGYMRILGLEERGMTARNRAAAETATKRRFQKLCGKKSWFKLAPDGGGREEKPFRTRKPTQAQVKAKIEAVMFVPYTQGGGAKAEPDQNRGEFWLPEKVQIHREWVPAWRQP